MKGSIAPAKCPTTCVAGSLIYFVGVSSAHQLFLAIRPLSRVAIPGIPYRLVRALDRGAEAVLFCVFVCGERLATQSLLEERGVLPCDFVTPILGSRDFPPRGRRLASARIQTGLSGRASASAARSSLRTVPCRANPVAVLVAPDREAAVPRRSGRGSLEELGVPASPGCPDDLEYSVQNEVGHVLRIDA